MNNQEIKQELENAEPWERLFIENGIFVTHTPEPRRKILLGIQPRFGKAIYISSLYKLESLRDTLNSKICEELAEAIECGEFEKDDGSNNKK